MYHGFIVLEDVAIDGFTLEQSPTLRRKQRIQETPSLSRRTAVALALSGKCQRRTTSDRFCLSTAHVGAFGLSRSRIRCERVKMHARISVPFCLT